MKIELKENERIDDLEYKGLKIIQNTKGFCFGMDAILISDFAKKIKNESIVVDLGTGTGIISILLSAKTNLKKMYAIEVQEEVCNMAMRSIQMNNLQEKIEIVNINVKELLTKIDKNSVDVVVTNPPYKKANSGCINESKNKLISRHEVLASLEDFIMISSKILKQYGEFYMVNRVERLAIIMELMKKYKIEPKEMRFVCSKNGSSPKLVLIKGVKNAKEYLKIKENLVIYNEDGTYTDEIYRIYNKERGKKDEGNIISGINSNRKS